MAQILPKYDARDLLAANVAALMAQSADKKTAKALAAACRWPATAGPKRRGEPLSERYIRYIVKPTPNDSHSPSLDVIVAIAAAFNTQAWRLLVDDKHILLYMMGKSLIASEGVSDTDVEKHIPAPPKGAPKTPQHQKKRSGNG